MAESECEYRFTIDAFTPETLPMSRLAEYMAGLKRLLGEVERVHFVRLDGGSTEMVQRIEPEAVPEIRKRIQSITCDDSPNDVTAAFTWLNRLLAADNATGSLSETESDLVIDFPGRDQQKPVTYGALNQQGVLDGDLIRIGGRDETVPVHLRDGDVIHICNTDRKIARRLGSHLYGRTLRVQGVGRWERDADGTWSLRRFNITEFEILDAASLSEVVGRLRGVEGSGWMNVDDTSAELERLRRPE